MRLQIRIDTHYRPFTLTETARALRRTASYIRNELGSYVDGDEHEGSILDDHGNRIGSWIAQPGLTETR